MSVFIILLLTIIVLLLIGLWLTKSREEPEVPYYEEPSKTSLPREEPEVLYYINLNRGVFIKEGEQLVFMQTASFAYDAGEVKPFIMGKIAKRMHNNELLTPPL